jgi:hypothetical protein
VTFRPTDGGSPFTWALQGVQDASGRALLTFMDDSGTIYELNQSGDDACA